GPLQRLRERVPALLLVVLPVVVGLGAGCHPVVEHFEAFVTKPVRDLSDFRVAKAPDEVDVQGPSHHVRSFRASPRSRRHTGSVPFRIPERHSRSGLLTPHRSPPRGSTPTGPGDGSGAPTSDP